ncbi:tetratricopeptide repeat protein 16 [Grus japonensis]|uniref:Tetratricopeptide repeat protein 16 n=1 Tax=Grus japonensis TaxID=30415 RepID=A0ABC9XL73_GRUJA
MGCLQPSPPPLAALCLAALNKFPESLWMLNRDPEEDVRNPELYVLRASFYKRFGQVWPLQSPRGPAVPPGGVGCAGKCQALRVPGLPRQLALCHQDIQWALELEPQHGATEAQRWRLLRGSQVAVAKTLCGDLCGAPLKLSFAIESDLSATEFFTLKQ